MARIQGIGGNNNSAGSQTTFAITFGAAVTSGNAVCGALSWDVATNTLTTITDDKANTYNLETVVTDATDGQRMVAFSLCNITNGPTVITAHFSGGTGNNALSMVADEFSGIATASADQRDGTAHGGQLQATPGTGANAVTSGNFTTTVNSDLLYGVTANTGAGDDTGTVVAGTTTNATYALTGSDSGHTGSNAAAELKSEWAIQSTAGATTAATFTASASVARITFLIALKATPAAAPAQAGIQQATFFVPGSGPTRGLKQTLAYPFLVTPISGTFAATEAPDVAAFNANFAIAGTLATTEGTDQAAFNGNANISGTLATTETVDTLAFVAAIGVSGSLSTTDIEDVAAFQGGGVILGTLTTTEATDTASFAGNAGESGSLSTTDSPDVCALIGNFGVSGTLITTDITDTASFFGDFGVPSGTLAANENADIAAFTGAISGMPSGALVVTETRDNVAFLGTSAPPPQVISPSPYRSPFDYGWWYGEEPIRQGGPDNN